MKRFFVAAAAAGLLAAGMGAHVSAADMCLYPSGDCWPDAAAACNNSWGWVFNGGTEGKGTYCDGGTYDKARTTNRKDTPLPTPDQTLLGCCYWGSSGQYDNVYLPSGETDCSAGLNTWWKGIKCGDDDADGNATRPSGTPTYDGAGQTVLGCCLWGSSGVYDNLTDATKASQCQTGVNTYWDGVKCAADESDKPSRPSGTPTYDGGSATDLVWCSFGECVPDPGDPYSCLEGGCYKKSAAECGEGGTVVESCPAGTLPPGPNSVRLSANAAKTPGLKVSYAKNRVTVNWTPAAKISKGTVQLINAKGVALSTAFIKDNSGKVSVKLGTVGVPAGMYFVHISAVGANGQRIVSQSAVSIVK